MIKCAIIQRFAYIGQSVENISKWYIFNYMLKFVFRLQITNSLNAKDLLFADKNKTIGKWH